MNNYMNGRGQEGLLDLIDLQFIYNGKELKVSRFPCSEPAASRVAVRVFGVCVPLTGCWAVRMVVMAIIILGTIVVYWVQQVNNRSTDTTVSGARDEVCAAAAGRSVTGRAGDVSSPIGI